MKALRALQPLVALMGLATLLIAVVTAVRAISARAGFLVERQIVLYVWLAGLVIVSGVFAWVVRRSMRRDPSRWGLPVMGLTVLVLAAPLALMLLQHPSP
ncbi:MAG: hypothetical protein M3Z28_04900 [Candidatus Dormibacteraeota bacterium]|nr:hypothetical protein [Candidatus Dormibacteraeota bacterium]